MKVKHTEGPWIFVDVVGGCQIWAGGSRLLNYASPTKRNLSNARLMASSPVMLSALEIVEAASIDIESSGSWGSIRITVEDWNFIKSAIAQAKGIQQ